MKRLNHFLLVAILFSTCHLSGQYSLLNSFFPEEPGNGTFYFDVAYNQKLSGTILQGGSGLAVDLGWNIGGHFTNKIVLAPYAGLSPRWGVKYDAGFLSYSKANSGLSELDPVDVEATRDFQDLLEGHVNSELSLYYGVIIRVPFRYFPITKLYISYLYSSGKGDKTGTTFYSDGTSRADFASIGRMHRSGYGAEVMLFRAKHVVAEGRKRVGMGLHLGYVSLYAEHYQAHTLGESGGEMSLGDFYLNPDEFKRQYGDEVCVGLKVGICFL